MRKLIVLLFIPLVISGCNRLDDNEFGTSLAYANLKGKVKGVKLSIHTVSKRFGEIKQGSICDDAYKHPLSSGVSCELNGDYYHGAICKRVYNESGMLLTTKWYDKDKELLYESANWYKDGRLVETDSELISTYLSNIICRLTYTYDQESSKLKKVTAYMDSDTIMTQSIEYSDNTETIRYGKQYSVTKIEKGIPSVRTSYDSVGNETSTTKYNSHGFEISSTSEHNTRELKYNKYNDPISLSEEIDSYTFDYEYDKKKNWIKRVTYKDGEPIYIERSSTIID